MAWPRHPALRSALLAAALPLALYAVALAARLPLLRMPIYGDEAVLYYLSRHPLQDALNIHPLDLPDVYRLGFFFWWRPGFRLLLVPGALVSFQAYRLLHLAITALLPVLTLLLLRALGVRRWIAAAAGLGVAVYPTFVHWGVIVFPDSTMVVAFTAGLLAWTRRRFAWAAAAFTAAIWLKEVAVVGVAFLGVWAAAEALRERRWRWWPPRPDAATAACLSAIVLGILPLLYYMGQGGAQPGWTRGGNGRDLPDYLWPSIWLAGFALAGLCWRRTRLLAALSFVYPAFYLWYAWRLDRGVELWYIVEPVFLGLLASVLVVDELWARSARSARRWPRAMAVGASVLVFGVVALQVLAPAAWTVKGELLAPIGHRTEASLQEVYVRDYGFDPLADLMAHLSPGDLRTAFLVDFGWFYIAYPFGEKAQTVRFAFTGYEFNTVHEIARWTTLVETGSNVTIVHTPATINPLNQALRTAYGDCATYTNVHYMVIHAAPCPGRTDRVVAEYERLTGRRLA
jgi:hypothetical protein